MRQVLIAFALAVGAVGASPVESAETPRTGAAASAPQGGGADVAAAPAAVAARLAPVGRAGERVGAGLCDAAPGRGERPLPHRLALLGVGAAGERDAHGRRERHAAARRAARRRLRPAAHRVRHSRGPPQGGVEFRRHLGAPPAPGRLLGRCGGGAVDPRRSGRDRLPVPGRHRAHLRAFGHRRDQPASRRRRADRHRARPEAPPVGRRRRAARPRRAGHRARRPVRPADRRVRQAPARRGSTSSSARSARSPAGSTRRPWTRSPVRPSRWCPAPSAAGRPS